MLKLACFKHWMRSEVKKKYLEFFALLGCYTVGIFYIPRRKL